MTKQKLPLAYAEAEAKRIVQWLMGDMHKIEVAGSVRRKAELVGDIEIVGIPKIRPDLFGEDSNSLYVDQTLHDSGCEIVKDGPRYKQFILPHEPRTQVDLFLTDWTNYGYILMLRTGPVDFSRRMVTARSKGGYKPDHIGVKDGFVFADGKTLDLYNERRLFDVWGMAFVKPEDRK